MYKTLNVWGRNFKLEIIYDVFTGEEVLDEQIAALSEFLKKKDVLLQDPTPVKEYCISDRGEEVGGSIDNIFKYVIPTSLYIKRETKNRVVALLCNYKFDIEHGLAIVFENEKLKEIGNQDII